MIIEIIGFGVVAFLAAGIRIVRPTDKLLIETLGKWTATKGEGFSWIIPIIQSARYVNITEQMVDVPAQTVITKDNLNAEVDAVVYYQIQDVKSSEYKVDDHESQLTSLARTTLRAVIGQMSFAEANENRDAINSKVESILNKETKSYGVDVLRTEIQKIEAPADVQQMMNEVVKAERKKIAAKDFATAKEVEADGDKRAEIKKAEGVKTGLILRAEGEAKALIEVANAKAEQIKVVNNSIQKHFIKNAIDYKKLETMETALKKGTKYVITDGKNSLVNVMSEASGVTPIPTKSS